MKIITIPIVILFLTNNLLSQESLSYLTGFGSDVHKAQRLAMNAVRAHKLQVVGQHTQVSSDGSTIVVLEVKPRKINCPVKNIIKD